MRCADGVVMLMPMTSCMVWVEATELEERRHAEEDRTVHSRTGTLLSAHWCGAITDICRLRTQH
jgi:hypothetical protein